MDADTPTHFNVILLGTGLVESITAAALSKAGYSVLQLDQNTYYGDEWASLSVDELAAWAAAAGTTDLEDSRARDELHASSEPASIPDELRRTSQRFSLSLKPTLLRAQGPAIDVLIRSKVASYLSFGLVNGVGRCKVRRDSETADYSTVVERVPASKADVFNDATLSLVEKRRLTKLLLFAAGREPFETSAGLEDNPTLQEYLRKQFSLPTEIAASLSYALCLCSSPDDLALPALNRLRSIIHSTGRYGPSPFLVGHYGGAGDLVGGFSRICAVWGGGQILGRKIGRLVRDATRGKVVPPSPAPFMSPETLPPPPAQAREDAAGVLGVPVAIEDGQEPTVFTADWIGVSPSHLHMLLPDEAKESDVSRPTAVRAIAVLPKPIAFPPPREPRTDEAIEPDTNLLVFPPGAIRDELGTVTALQVGPGTSACPPGHFVLYLHSPVLNDVGSATAQELLSPYLDGLLRSNSGANDAGSDVQDTSAEYVVYSFVRSPARVAPDVTLSPSLMVTPNLPSDACTAGLVTALDVAVVLAEEMFWTVVGDQGKREGVEFFARGSGGADEDEED